MIAVSYTNFTINSLAFGIPNLSAILFTISCFPHILSTALFLCVCFVIFFSLENNSLALFENKIYCFDIIWIYMGRITYFFNECSWLHRNSVQNTKKNLFKTGKWQLYVILWKFNSICARRFCRRVKYSKKIWKA